MIHLTDTNVLLRFADPSALMRVRAEGAIEALFDAGDEPCVVPQNLFEFWVVATRPTDRNGLGLTASAAAAQLARIEAMFRLLRDPPDLYDEWRALVTARGIVGSRAHDVRLVAAMRVHGITHLLTFNTEHFRGFPGITVVDPASVLGGEPQK